MKKFILFILLSILLTACGASSQGTPESLIPMNVCYSALAGTQAATWYAYEEGLFGKFGLQVNLVSMSGGTAAVTALVSGDMDMCQVASPAVASAVAAGQDVVIIAGLINTVPGSLFAQPEITSPEMLIGKIIGIHQGSNTEVITRIMLSTLGLDPDNDVVLLNIGGEPERMAAMAAKQIDATFMNPPLSGELRTMGYVELFNAADAQIPYQGTSIATTRNFIENNRPEVISFMKAITEAIFRIKEDPEGSKGVLAKYLSLDVVADAADLDESYTVLLVDTLQEIPYPTLEGLQLVIDLAAVENPGVALVNPEELVDSSIVQELEDSGFFSDLK